MRNMAMNNKLKKCRKIIKNTDGSVTVNEGTIVLSKTGTTAARFHKVDKYC
jgi:hypothetical protein